MLLLPGHNVAQESRYAGNDVGHARIEPIIEQEAAIVLAAMGLSLSDAFRTPLTSNAPEKTLPDATCAT
jgi:antitoxin component of RelBE/YafQ-DinJ toxin-antitoxin module